MFDFLQEDTNAIADEYFKNAVKIVMMAGYASISYLQRKLNIGYSRAAKIIDKMEESGFIAPTQADSKKREILITPEKFREVFGEEYNSYSEETLMCEMCKKINILKEETQPVIDDYFKAATKLVMVNGSASISLLQRRLSIGYSRASGIIDEMIARKYISPIAEDKTRKVLITPEQFRKDFGEEYNS